MSANSFNDRLQMLLMDAEKFTPGSQQRTESLEQIRSMLLDKKASGSSNRGGVRKAGQGGTGFSPDDQLLEDFYLGNSTDNIGSLGLSAIPETSAADKIWENSQHLSGGFGVEDDDGHFHDDLDTFHMDDVNESLPHLAGAEGHPQMMPTPGAEPKPKVMMGAAAGTAIAATAGAPAATPSASVTTAASPLKGKPPASMTGSAAGVLGGNLAKTPVTPVRQGTGARGGGGKGSPSQMSSLAKEEQAAIPHVTAGDLSGVPLVPMNMEPDKRLSHKEVEQRRREKAKQYFDELRGLLPYGGDSAKFDKNAILHHSILLIKQLIGELEVEEAAAAKPVPGKASAPDFRSCFDVSRQPMCFTGLDSRLWDANTAFCTLMGYNRMEITGLSLLSATAPCDADTSSQHWNQILKSTGATSVTYICKLVRKDAQQIQCSIDLSLVWKQGKPQCLLVSANPSI